VTHAHLSSKELEKATSSVPVALLSNAAPVENFFESVIIERPVTLAVYRVGEFTLMCTPIELEALAVGFAFSEGMIDSMDDVIGIHRSEDKSEVVALEINDPSKVVTGRNMIVASSCGLCGTRTIERTLSEMPVVANSLTISRDLLLRMTDKLFALQQVHPVTRGAHAAGIFDAQGQIEAFGEDIGRHNALDKALGKCLLARRATKGRGAVLSSRASFEMVAKAARAGIEILIAASAPSLLAIDAADRWNVTLCGSARAGRAKLYSHAHRVA
jgi:FdhD protein